jgi:hypothetical protein
MALRPLPAMRGVVVCVALVVLLVAVFARVGSSQAVTAAAAVPPTSVPVSADGLRAYGPAAGYQIQHQSEVETDTFSWGSTVVSAFQVGRNSTAYGAQAIGWATSSDRGVTWKQGILPGLTASSLVHPNPAFPLVVNQSVAYSARFGTWLIPSVTYQATGTAFREKALMLNRAVDGVRWSDAVTALSNNVDKAWAACDNSSASPFYGNCYIAYSQIDNSYRLAFITSRDGGVSWSAPRLTATGALGYNAIPTIAPSGRVVVVATDATRNGLNGSAMFSIVSTDGGSSWSSTHPLTTVRYHPPAGGLRAMNKPTVDVDAAGTIYAAWGDCRFESNCAANDIVLARSIDGLAWTVPARVTTNPVGSIGDHFIPGLAVLPGSAGPRAQLGLVFYSYPHAVCSAATCAVDVTYLTSLNGGVTWSAPYRLNPASMSLAWLATGSRGPMVGDYESVSFVGGSAVTVYPLATAPSQGTLHEAEYATAFPPGWTQ